MCSAFVCVCGGWGGWGESRCVCVTVGGTRPNTKCVQQSSPRRPSTRCGRRPVTRLAGGREQRHVGGGVGDRLGQRGVLRDEARQRGGDGAAVV